MIEPNRETSFVQEHLLRTRIGRVLEEQTLDDHELLHPHRAFGDRERHVSHPAAADARDQKELPERRPAGRLRHLFGSDRRSPLG
jgi:hypothetical protein